MCERVRERDNIYFSPPPQCIGQYRCSIWGNAAQHFIIVYNCLLKMREWAREVCRERIMQLAWATGEPDYSSYTAKHPYPANAHQPNKYIREPVKRIAISKMPIFYLFFLLLFFVQPECIVLICAFIHQQRGMLFEQHRQALAAKIEMLISCIGVEQKRLASLHNNMSNAGAMCDVLKRRKPEWMADAALIHLHVIFTMHMHIL